MTVAIVEDDEGMRESLALLFDVHGVTSRSYVSAEEFLADPAAADTSFLLVDHHLPGMTGVELLDHLASAGTLPRAVLVSARLTDAVLRAALGAGAVSALEKPVPPGQLIALVRP